MSSLRDELEKKLQDSHATPMFLPLEFLKAITCDFSTELELGRGGYGVVYKGVLQSGKIIAVKKLFEIHLLDDKTFQKEVSCLKEIKHQHVVQFIGYCAESSWELIDQPTGRSIWAEIPKRLLCSEYVCNKSLDKYISVSMDESSALGWNMRYEIIKGICIGLNFLHEECRIVHLDLKPENILMDASMIPKIADFGLSRILGTQQSRIVTDNCAGSRGYMAPEYLIKGVVSVKADIFSLGAIIIEIITGHREYPYFQLDDPQSTVTSCQHFIEKVLGSWRNKFESTAKYASMEKYIQQVKQCVTVALKCVNPDMEKRPTAKDIVQVLNEVDQMEANNQLPSEMWCKDKSLVLDTTVSKGFIPHSTIEDLLNIETSVMVGDVKKSQECLSPTPSWKSATSSQNHEEAAKETSEPQQASDKTSEVIPGSSMLLDVHPLELCFRFEPNKLIPCSLDLKNNTDEQVAFGLLKKSNEETCFFSSLPMFGIVARGATYTLVVTMKKHEYPPQERNVDLILKTSKYDGRGIFCGVEYDCKQHFQKAEELGNIVHRVTLKGVCALHGETIFESIPSSIKILSMEDRISNIFAMDANQTEPLIITGSNSSLVHIWNSDKQKSKGSIYIPKAVWSVKFIARMGWFLAGTDDGFIHVCNYKNDGEEITRIKAHSSYFKAQRNYILSLAIHPTHSYVLSACTTRIKLWDWDHRWKCMRTFKEHSNHVRALAFNPEDYKSFASASDDCTIKVWSLDSSKSKYTLSGHSSWVRCLDFFTRDGQQYLITGSYDQTAKIWDMKQKECVRTLPHRSWVKSVLPHPSLPVIVTGTDDGRVHLWSSINFRLKRILDIGVHKEVRGLACLTDSGRVVVAHLTRVSVIEIRDEEEQGESSSSNNENSISAAD